MEVHRSMPEDSRDYAAELHCLQQLDDAVAAAKVLKSLLQGVSMNLSPSRYIFISETSSSHA